MKRNFRSPLIIAGPKARSCLLIQFWGILPVFPLSRIWALVQSSSKYWGTWTLTRSPQPRQSFSALGSSCMTLKHWSKSPNQKIHLFLQLSNCSPSQKSNWKVFLKMETKKHRSFGFNSKISMEVPSTLSSPGSTEFWRTLVSSKKLSMKEEEPFRQQLWEVHNSTKSSLKLSPVW